MTYKEGALNTVFSVVTGSDRIRNAARSTALPKLGGCLMQIVVSDVTAGRIEPVFSADH